MKLGELLGGLRVAALLLLLLLLAAGGLLALAVDLVEGSDFREEHVARRAPDRAVGPQVLHPQVVAQQLVRLGAQLL